MGKCVKITVNIFAIAVRMEEIMKIKDIMNELNAFQEYIYFDEDEFLREKTSDHRKLKQLLKNTKQVLKGATETSDNYFLWGSLGYLYRIGNQPEKAIHFLTLALDAVKEKDVTKEII